MERNGLYFPPAHLTGVSIEPSPITAVDMRTAAFVGVSPRHDTPPGSVRLYSGWDAFRNEQLRGVHGGRRWNDIAHAVQGFFLNGGERCYVANTGIGGSVADGLAALAPVEDAAIVVAPAACDAPEYEAIVRHCEVGYDRMAILDGPSRVDEVALRLMRGEPADAQAPLWRPPPLAPRGTVALYTPWIRVADPEGPAGATVRVPASGHIAGLWSRLAATHGLSRSQAGESLVGALDVANTFSDGDLSALSATGVNTLRLIPGRGVVVWGARTLSQNLPWRYVAVRRVVNLISESLRRGTRWAAYETPSEAVMVAIRRHVGDFLDRLWRQGELQGASPREAYFVRCDETTTTAADVRTGTLVLVVGLAVLRPGEFATLPIRQAEAGAEVVESA